MHNLPDHITRRRHRTCEFIEANLGRHITLAEMSSVCGLSPYHFAHSFKTVMGMTPMQYVAMRRVERAKVLLTAGHDVMADIAYQCGFASQSHFCTVFKAATGMTPSGFQRQDDAKTTPD